MYGDHDLETPLLTNGDPARIAARRMLSPTPTTDLIRPLTISLPQPSDQMRLIPLRIRLFQIKLPYNHNKQRLNLRQRKCLANTVMRAELERAPGTLNQIKGIFGLAQEAV